MDRQKALVLVAEVLIEGGTRNARVRDHLSDAGSLIPLANGGREHAIQQPLTLSSLAVFPSVRHSVYRIPKFGRVSGARPADGS